MATTPTAFGWFNRAAAHCPMITMSMKNDTVIKVPCVCSRRAQSRMRWASPAVVHIVTRRTIATMIAEPGIEMIRKMPVSWLSSP